MRADEALARIRDLPFATDLETLTGSGPALVLAPHADDESLGCGGLIAESCAQGRAPTIAIVTDGAGSHPNSAAWPPARLRAQREREALDAVTILGLPEQKLHFLRLPDAQTPSGGGAFEAAVSQILALACDEGCTTILAPWFHDPHGDHVAVQLMAQEAGRQAAIRVLSYPVWGWTLPADFILPDAPITGWRFGIARHMPAKQRAIAAHVSQHGRLITDDPDGFTLPPHLLAVFREPWEAFLS